MPKMVATKPITYGGKTLAAGDVFDVEDNYVATLVSLGRASLQENGGKKSTKAKATTTRSSEAEGEAEGESSEYKTRRLKADE